MAKPSKAEIKSKALKGLIALVSADAGEYWYGEAAELLPNAGDEELWDLAGELQGAAIKKVEALVKPKAVGVLALSKSRR